MTLISLTTNFGCPILIGDILTTSNIIDQEIELPTFLKSINEFLPEDQVLYPYKFRQKIYVINDLIAIGLAGYEFDMKILLDDFKTYFKFKEPTHENVEEFFRGYDLNEVKDCEAIIICAKPEGEYIDFKIRTIGNWQQSDSVGFEKIFACGSGGDDFLREANQSMIYANAGESTHLHKAISYNYMVLSNLLSKERLSLDTIKKYWGAGFEMIYFDGQKFRKMDDITYLIWRGKIDLDSERYEISPFLIMNFKYYNELLLINSTNFEKMHGFGVLPIYLNKEDIDNSILPTQANFNSHKICCTMLFDLSNGKSTTPSFFAEDFEKPGTVSIDFDADGQLGVWIQEDFLESYINSIRQVIAGLI